MAKTKKIKKDAVVLTARDMLNGYVANNYDYNIYNMTPLQMIPEEEKDEDWKKWNLDWLERAGLRQLYKEAPKIIKNYHLANGILDKSDYIISNDNDVSEQINIIVGENANTLPIKFFPIIPNVINILCGEFAKRDTRVIAKAVDQTSIDEAYEYKKKLLTDILVQKAEQDKLREYQAMGIEMDNLTPEEQQQISQDIDVAKAMAEAEVKFKNYRGIVEQWANHMILLDNDRFDMYSKEGKAFRDSLICDREFWHIKVTEDDYFVEVWDPWTTFYHKSPHVEYISDGNFVGRIMLMSVPDIIDTYGSLMTEDQLLELKNHYRTLNTFPLVTDSLKDQENLYTNFSRPDGRTNVTWQKYLDSEAGKLLNGQKPPDNNLWNLTWNELGRIGQYMDVDINGPGMVRVTEAYWKSQKRVGHLTRVKKDGTVLQEIIDENYVVHEEPVYDLSIQKTKRKENLVAGEHIDWIWINEVRWGVKLNSSLSAYYTRNYSDFEPIYLGGDPIPYQFKSTSNIYGCRLPIEGKIFSQRGSYSHSMVDKMRANQVGFNIVNNQILEFLADEVGNVMVIDQNMIPRNSMKGQWGQYNFPMFYQVMKDYQIAAIDPSIRNTEGATNFSHFQQVDMSKTNQIMTRIQLAQYFKNEAFAVVGITPQRLGEVSASETATGTQQAVNNSYSQTEPYFDQHMNYLMPRVRDLMICAAQYSAAHNPENRKTYLNSDEENIFFDIDADRVTAANMQIRSRSTANIKAVVDRLYRLAEQNQSVGGSLYEYAQIFTTQSPSEIISKLGEAEDRRRQEMEQQRQHEMQMQAEQQAFLDKETERIQAHDDYWKEREIQKEIYIAEIKALGFAKDQDINSNQVPDPLEVDRFLHEQGLGNQQLQLKQQDLQMKNKKLDSDQKLAAEKMDLEREKLKSKEKIERIKLRNKVSGEK